MSDTVILVASTGTGSYENCARSIGAVERAIAKAFPQYEVRRVFTGRTVTQRLKERDGLEVESLEEALLRAEREGVKGLLVQPTYLLRGDQYAELVDTMKRCAGRFERTAVGKPLLDDERDIDAVIEALIPVIEEWAGVDKEPAVLLVGHGTKNGADSIYARIREKLHSAGFENYDMVSLKDRFAKERAAAAGCREKFCKKVVLVPFMLVSGFHAARDIAGDQEDSWKSLLEAAGYEVSCMPGGLGEIPAIQDIYVKHVEAAFYCHFFL